MELSGEDSLRLNVLLASKPKAIRIDESRLEVLGLTDKGVAKVRLNPLGRPESYVKTVRELISGHILGSPGGYPVYLRRWTRMGQLRNQSLEQLLMLGEPEAVVAAVGSPGLTEELARRAWWAMEDAENARRMLRNPTIVASAMGPVLADYLLEYLPFETETDPMTESVRLILQPGLLDEVRREELWRKSARKQAYLVGFLLADPDALPESGRTRVDLDALSRRLQPLVKANNGIALQLLRVMGAAGQVYLSTVATVLTKPPNQDVVSALFDCLREYFSVLRPDGDPRLDLAALEADASTFVASDAGAIAVLEICPELRSELEAMRFLSGVGYGLIRPVLSDPTTLGSLMRRKLKPITDPIEARLTLLRG